MQTRVVHVEEQLASLDPRLDECFSSVHDLHRRISALESLAPARNPGRIGDGASPEASTLETTVDLERSTMEKVENHVSPTAVELEDDLDQPLDIAAGRSTRSPGIGDRKGLNQDGVIERPLSEEVEEDDVPASRSPHRPSRRGGEEDGTHRAGRGALPTIDPGDDREDAPVEDVIDLVRERGSVLEEDQETPDLSALAVKEEEEEEEDEDEDAEDAEEEEEAAEEAAVAEVVEEVVVEVEEENTVEEEDIGVAITLLDVDSATLEVALSFILSRSRAASRIGVV
ncbi:hypothetical protein T484DRAFT_1879912 [Baffinella frigidus]|nr:hypothetical protein T484DRAFT_1879912 [Cryptophyta sp. CCMP2293]